MTSTRPLRLACVFPCDALALATADLLESRGLVEPVLIGPLPEIVAAGERVGMDARRHPILDTGPDPGAAAQRAVAEARRGAASALMKGSLQTGDFLKPIVSGDGGLRTDGTRISHVSVFDVPRYHKLLAVTDCAINIAPDAGTRRDIVANAVATMAAIGLRRPRVALLAATEKVNPAIGASVDAARLARMSRADLGFDAIVDGPFGLDNAISAAAAAMKKIDSPVCGEADILVVPDLNAGNILHKSLSLFAGAESAAVVAGASVPVVLTSRSDSLASRIASVALAAIMSESTGRSS